MQNYTDHVQDQYGNAISGASVLISQNGSPATIYSDNGVTPKANPLTTGSNGEYSFYAAGGTYIPTVTTSAGSLVSHAVTLFDPEDLAAPTGSALVGFLQAGPGAVARTMQDKLRDTVSVRDFGAVGDGVTDDTAAIQAFLDLGIPGILPAGTYLTTDELVFKHGSRLFGMGNWSGVASTFSTQGVSRILYDGAGGANSCIVRMSDAAVGTDPVTADTCNLQNIGLTGVVLDGNDLAEFGLYCVRAWSNNPLDFITVTRTLKHAFWAGKCWNGSPRNWHAYKNRGAGITLGKDTFSWGSAAVDQSVCTSFFGYYSGCDNSGVPLNDFDETTDPEKEYGVGVFSGRGLVMVNAQANECSGPGLYVSPSLKPVKFVGGYAEANGRSSGSTAAWDIWFSGAAGGNSQYATFDGVHLGLTTSTRLTGTVPSRVEAGPIFRNMPFLGTIDADWSNYRVIDSDRSVVFSGTAPAWFREARNGVARNLDTAGICTFDATAGSVSILMKEGLISDVTYTSAGTYAVTLAETFSSARYGIQLSTGDNRIVAAGSITTSGFNILHRTVAGALTDGNARITVTVTGYYV
jgi:hypothetical protein